MKARGRIQVTLGSPDSLPPGLLLKRLDAPPMIVLRAIDLSTYEVLEAPLSWRERLLVLVYKVDYQIGRAWLWLVRHTQ